MLQKLLQLFQKKEITKGGSVVMRHTTGNSEVTFSSLTNEEMQLINEHVEKYIGPIDQVLHELVSTGIHLDILHIKPSKKLPFNILVTMGASEYKMNMPENLADHFSYAEYVIFLPKDWHMSQADWKNDDNYWPIRMLKEIARMPNTYNTWLYYGHTIPNGNPSKPYSSNTKLDGCLITFPYLINEEFLILNSHKKVAFWCLAPLYESEVEYKLEHGVQKLEDLAEKVGVKPYLIDSKRAKIV